MFRVTGGGSVYDGLTAREAGARARALRAEGLNDVEIFESEDRRISLYKLDQIVRLEAGSGGGPA
jgi:hypothetical protein